MILKGSYKYIWPYDYELHISKDFSISMKHKDCILTEDQKYFRVQAPSVPRDNTCTPALTTLMHLCFFPKVAGSCLPDTRTLVLQGMYYPTDCIQRGSLTMEIIKNVGF